MKTIKLSLAGIMLLLFISLNSYNVFAIEHSVEDLKMSLPSTEMIKEGANSLKELTEIESQEVATKETMSSDEPKDASEENTKDANLSKSFQKPGSEKSSRADDIKTGIWGSAPYEYNEETYELKVSSGELKNEKPTDWTARGINSQQIKKITFLNTVYLPSDATNFFGMTDANSFHTFKTLETIIGWNYLDTSKVINMSYMFNQSKLTELDLSSFDTSNVTSMDSMFRDTKVTELDLSGFDTSKVMSMRAIFYSVQATELDVSSFKTSNVTDMGYMFFGAKATELDVSNFDTSKVTFMDHMFSSAQAKELVVNGFDTSNVKTMSNMFYSAKAAELDVSHFDTSKVNRMDRMFSRTQVKELDVSGFDTTKVTNMSSMFNQSKLTELDVSSFNTTSVTDMSNVFSDTTLTELDVSGFVTTNVTNMSSMFSNTEATELDVSSFDTANVTDMNLMFSDIKVTKLDISGFDTSQVENMKSMFAHSEIDSLSLGKDFLFGDSALLTGPGGNADAMWQKEDLSSKPYLASDFMREYGSGDLTPGIYVANKSATATINLKLLSEGAGLISTVGNDESLTVSLSVTSEAKSGQAMATDIVLDLTEIIPNWELNETLEAKYRAPNSSNVIESTVTVDLETMKIEIPDLVEGSNFEVILKGKTWNNTTQGKISDNITKVAVDYSSVASRDNRLFDSQSDQINHEINNGGLFFDKIPNQISFKQTAFSANSDKKFIDRKLADWSLDVSDLRGTNPISVENTSVARQNWEVTALAQPFKDDEGVAISTSTLELFYIQGNQHTPLNTEAEVIIFSQNVEGETPKENAKRVISWEEDQGIKLKAHNNTGLYTNKKYQAQIDLDLRLAP